MRKLWDKEILAMKLDLQKDCKTKAQKLAIKNWTNPDSKLSDFFIKQYLERTKFKYVLAFL
jgi:hypothetical protein